eukprot:scaffold309944_cov19-Prasinocladus_malaysianus.AAC.1
MLKHASPLRQTARGALLPDNSEQRMFLLWPTNDTDQLPRQMVIAVLSTAEADVRSGKICTEKEAKQD